MGYKESIKKPLLGSGSVLYVDKGWYEPESKHDKSDLPYDYFIDQG